MTEPPTAESASTSMRLAQLAVALVGGAFGLPVLYIGMRSLQLANGEAFAESLAPAGRSLLLGLSVTTSASIIGTALGWLLAATDLPGRGVLGVLLPLPLVLPSFVGAAALLGAVTPTGVLYELIALMTGFDGQIRLRGFWPSWLVLTSFTYPYVLLPVMARSASLRPSLHESARLLGRSPVRAFAEVTLRHLRPAMISGALLVFLYSLSEFGAVQLLAYDTLTRVIYSSLVADEAVSFVSAGVLMALAVAVVAVERIVQPNTAADDRAERHPGPSSLLGRWRPFAAAVAWLVVVVSFLLPLASLSLWAWRGVVASRIDYGELARPTLNTVLAGSITAVLAVAAMLPLAVLVIRFPSRLATVASGAVLSGFALPGVVLALSAVFWTLKTPGFGWLYQTFTVLIAVYVVHFGSQALGVAESAVRAVPLNLRESAHLLDPSRLRRIRHIQIPLMRPGLVSGGGLVLLSTVKELPATLLLAPVGFETLATEIWSSYEEAFYADVGVASLLLIAVSGALTWRFVLRGISDNLAVRF